MSVLVQFYPINTDGVIKPNCFNLPEKRNIYKLRLLLEGWFVNEHRDVFIISEEDNMITVCNTRREGLVLIQ